MRDDDDWPIGLTRYGEPARRFERWRREHPSEPASRFWDDTSRSDRSEPPSPLTAEQQREAWKAEQDDGFLTSRERRLVDLGIAPPLTPARISRYAVLALAGVLLGSPVLALVLLQMSPATWMYWSGGAGGLLLFGGVVLVELLARRRRGRRRR